MTHLKIEQNNGIIEQVSPSVIEKLYEIVHSGNLDSSSNLMGSLNTTSTYQNYVDYLEEQFTKNGVRQLIISANKLYIYFADPEVNRVFANRFGDNVGVTKSDLSGITKIPNRMFEGNTTITSFDELRNLTNITELDEYCFNGATNLSSIDLSNIEIIRFAALNNVPLEIINLPKATSVGSVIGINGILRELNIGSEVPDNQKITSIPDSFLRDRVSVTSVTGLKMVTEIGSFGFGNTRLLEVDTTSNLTTIGEYAFWATKIKCIDLSGVTTLSGGSQFNSCSELIDLSTSDQTQINTGAVTYTFNWSTIPNNLFQSCKLTNKSFSFPNATSIGENAFRSSGIVGINSPNVTSIGDSAFQQCSSLTLINLPNVTSIGGYVFQNCNKLTTLDLSNVTTIWGHAFAGCTSLTQFPCDPSIVTQIWDSAFENCTNMGQDTILELNLTQQTKCPQYGFYGTKFKGLILHWPSLSNLTFDGRYNIWENMLQLEYLDMSDTVAPIFDSTNQYRGFGFYQNPNITTAIFPATMNYLSDSIFTLRSSVNDNTKYKYLILLSTTPPYLNQDSSNAPRSTFFGNRPALNIYVPDSALSSYLSDSNWLQLGDGTNNFNLSDRVKGLSELPAGVWTTGLASSYLTPAQLVTS